MSSHTPVSIKRRRDGGERLARLLPLDNTDEEGGGGAGADTPIANVAQVGLLPEQVALALANNNNSEQYDEDESGGGGDMAPVLAGVEARTARAYTLIGNTLFTWQVETAELGKTMEPPADRSLELLDRQGYACVTLATPAVAVLAPLGPRTPVAVVLANGRLIWRELERGGAKSEYTAQLESGEQVTTATWEVVGGDLVEEGEGDVMVMAFLGTSHGRVYRVGPLGGGGGGGGAAAGGLSSGPMARPGGLTDYLPWRLRGPGPLEGVRSLLVWQTKRSRTRRVLTLTGENAHLYDASGAIVAQVKVLEQVRVFQQGGGREVAELVGATLVRPGVALVAAVCGEEGEEGLWTSLFLLDMREDENWRAAAAGTAPTREYVLQHLTDVDPPSGDMTVRELLRARLEASKGNTHTDAVAYLLHPSEPHQDGVVTALHFKLAPHDGRGRGGGGGGGGGGGPLRVEGLRECCVHVPRSTTMQGNPAMGGVIGGGMLLCTDMLILLAGPDRVMRVRALRHAHTQISEQQHETGGGGDETRTHDIATKARRAFKLYMELQPAQAQAVVAAEGLLDLSDGMVELAGGLLKAVWEEVDLEPDMAPYWGGQGGGRGGGGEEEGGGEGGGGGGGYHLLIQHSLRRKLAISEKWLRFLEEMGLWAKLTEAQGARLVEGAERVAACVQLCAGLVPGRALNASFAELLHDEAMPYWGADLAPDVRLRLQSGGLPPLDVFLSNPSKITTKLASLQTARHKFNRRAIPPVSLKKQIEASMHLTRVLQTALDAAVATRKHLHTEHGLLHPQAGKGGWLADTHTLAVMEKEVAQLRWVAETGSLTREHALGVGEMARRLGELWLKMGGVWGEKWDATTAGIKKRQAVLCVESFGLVDEALALARWASAWDVLGELQFRYRARAPQALVDDMATHQEVAAHVLGWLLENRQLDYVLEYGATSPLARGELERLFVSRPDQPAAVRLAWMHHVHMQEYGRASEDLKSLAEEEKTLGLKKLWVNLGILSDEAARRHLRPSSTTSTTPTTASHEACLMLKEEQDLLQAQAQLVPLLREEVQGGGQGQQQQRVSTMMTGLVAGIPGDAVAKLLKGETIGPIDTIHALIHQVSRQPNREVAVDLALNAMDLLDYYQGRRQELRGGGLQVEKEVERIWAALVGWQRDWERVWRDCDAVIHPGSQMEATAFAQTVWRYMRPRGGEGQRVHYPTRLATPTDAVLRAAVQALLRTKKQRPEEKALVTVLKGARDTVMMQHEQSVGGGVGGGDDDDGEGGE